ncbi:MAG TPA: VOC family protein [Methylomirabilota bacterium]|nr:VOC family protein [Methylomirabilota bacterium]
MGANKIITWFQIPARDIDRATNFYTAVVGGRFHRIDDPHGGKHAFFRFDQMEPLRTGGEIYQGPREEPSSSGVLIYLAAPEGLDAAVKKVAPAGGQVVMPRLAIGEHGVIALIIDTEGNRIGLHAEN